MNVFAMILFLYGIIAVGWDLHRLFMIWRIKPVIKPDKKELLKYFKETKESVRSRLAGLILFMLLLWLAVT